MGNFSRQTYNQIKHYVSVRLQQGVPLVDADWNEREDIRRYELQAFLKWFVGDGVPLGDSGFLIVPRPGVENDFYIRTGRCLVEGLDVVNEGLIVDGEVVNDLVIAYSEQTLTDTAIATALGVAPVPLLTTAPTDGDYTAYLDIWEREVLPGEIGDDPYVFDRNLINEDIGLPTCTRTKREWVVRVVAGTTLPTPVAGHLQYPLARIARHDDDAVIHQADITDLRRTGLKIGSYNDTRQIVRDAFGDGYTLDGDGEPNLKVSLREAINAALKGTIPMGPASALSITSSVDDDPYAITDANGNIWAFWESYRSGNWDIWYKRYDAVSETWGPEVQLTSDVNRDYNPNAVADAGGDIWFFWRSNRSGNYDIWCKRYRSATDTWDAEVQLSEDAATDMMPRATVDGVGDVWVFWYSYRNIGGTYNYDVYHRRFRRSTSTWEAEVAFTTDAVASDYGPFPMTDHAGDVWLFWNSNASGDYDIWYSRYEQAAASWGPHTRMTYDAGSDTSPYAVVDSAGDVWVFWESDRSGNYDIWCRRFSLQYGYWNSSSDIQISAHSSTDTDPRVVADSEGGVWVFWRSYRYGDSTVVFSRYSSTGGWTDAKPLITEGYNRDPQAVLTADGDIWVFWGHEEDIEGIRNIWERRLIPQV